MLNSILTGALSSSVSTKDFVICTMASLVFGVILAVIHSYHNQTSRNFMLTLILLPVIVQTVIMMVNGNLGTGVAVMGAFSLVRFRSVPGNSREISSIFLAMAVGLADGMGYIGAAGILLVVVAAVTGIILWWPGGGKDGSHKELKVVIPENLEYQGIFDDLFQKYTRQAQLIKVRTVNMGSLYELQYHIHLIDERQEKEFLDQIRCRNGNLNLVCGQIPVSREEL